MSKARGLADLGNVYNDSALSNRNLIINGAMQVNQRGTTTSTTVAGYYACDRFTINLNALGAWTISQSTDAPVGFGSSYKAQCTTADAAPAANDYIAIRHVIEGQNLQQLKKGTADALPVTLSFWVKCFKTGDFQVNLNDADNGRHLSSVFTVNTSATWEYKTATFVGDATGAFDNDNARSMDLEFWLDAGSTYTSGAVPTVWETIVGGDRAAGTTLALGDSVSNYLQITGVQLEVGDTATPFEHRSYGQELALCQRYYQVYSSLGAIYAPKTSNDGYNVWFGTLPTRMRASPTLVETSGYGWSLYSNGMSYEFYRSPATNAITPSWTADAEL